MVLGDLVGKKVIRVAPMQNGDMSYMNTTNEITVLDFVDGFPIVSIKPEIGKVRVEVFTGWLNDDKWVDATNVYQMIEAYKGINEIKSRVEKK